MSIKEFKGVHATLQEVTFKEFVESIQNQKAYHTVEQYNTQVGYGSPGGQEDNKTNSDNDSTYIRSVNLVDELTDLKVMGDLIDGCTFKTFPYDHGMNDRVEDAILESVENFGIPTHLVKLSDKTVAVLCKDDFIVRRLTDTTGTLIGYAPLRNIIFKRFN